MPLTLQLPAMPLTDLLPILERKAQQAKNWEGPAAWRYHLGMQARGKQSVHLEIWPQSLIDDIIQICEDLGLQLQQLASLSALSESQLSTLGVEPGEDVSPISRYSHCRVSRRPTMYDPYASTPDYAPHRPAPHS